MDYEVAIRELPQFDTENPKMISQGPSVCLFNKEDPQEVLASWLFMQFLLTNDVQIAYSQTEGYAPVTRKAQESEEYTDYLSREGEDNGLYYDIKLKATKLLIANTDNTFVTPVFNGSTSLRDAAGQMIEETTKAVRRGKVVDEAFIDELYDNISSLYRLKGLVGEKIPAEAILLLSAIGAVWVIMGSYVAVKWVKKKKREKILNKY